MATLKVHVKTEYGFVESESTRPPSEAFIDVLAQLSKVDDTTVQAWVATQTQKCDIQERLTEHQTTQWIA